MLTGPESIRLAPRIVLLYCACFLMGEPAMAQVVTGTLGEPSVPATTIPGTQIPAPTPPFGGVIKETLEGSKTWWPPRIVPPKGAPNVLLIMTDDQGYGVSRHLRRRHPDTDTRCAGRGRPALHAIQLNRALLPDPGGAHYRPQPPLGRLRRDHRAVDRVSRL